MADDPLKHRTQLRICHQRIASEVVVSPNVDHRTQFCSLTTGLRWCATCGFYVCDVHAEARHVAHHLIED